jgi:hypothetical protein
MNTKPNLIISLVVLLAAMLLLVSCNPNQPDLVSASGPEPVEAIAVDEFEAVEVVPVVLAELGSMQQKSGGFSGDDSYDPAVEWKIDSVEGIKAPAEEYVFSQISGGSFSGEDVYDPAANLTIEIPLGEHNFTKSGENNNSGDDDYDPAAGGEF